jgi:hypothetical protein
VALTFPQSSKLQGYIEGLSVETASPWTNLDDIVIGSGAAYVPGFGDIVELAAPTNIPAGALTNNTLYHLYLYADPTTGAGLVEASTQGPPTGAYRGQARVKGPTVTPDNSRRYIGMARSGTGVLYRIKMGQDGWVYIYENPFASTTAWLVANDSRVTTPTNIACSGKIPAHVREVMMRIEHYGTQYLGIATDEHNLTLSGSAPAWDALLGTNAGWGMNRQITMRLNESQQFRADYTADPGAASGLFAGIQAYKELR